MGLFDDIQREVSNAGRSVVNPVRSTLQQVGNANRNALGSFGYLSPLGPHQVAADFFNQEDNVQRAQEEADRAREREQESINQMDRVRSGQMQFANQLRQNAGRDAGLLTDRVASNERRAMAENIRNAKLGASSRGLIGSGFQKSQEAGARAQAASNTASKQRQIEQLSHQQVRDAEDLAANLGLEMGGIQQSNSDKYYQMALQNMQNRNASYSDILSAGGRLGGTYLGSQNQPTARNWWEVD